MTLRSREWLVESGAQGVVESRYLDRGAGNDQIADLENESQDIEYQNICGPKTTQNYSYDVATSH